MASDEEDVDLQQLRNAVLATLKSSPVQSKDEDLEVLRQAALCSKKQIEKKSNNFSRNDGIQNFKIQQQNDKFCWRRPNSNLIEIKPLPLEDDDSTSNSVPYNSFRPFNSTHLYVKEETSSQPKDNNKPKRSSKFSRFESDSDSDSDSDYSLSFSSPGDSTKEDDEGSVVEMSQTPQEENSLDQTASQSSDKENEDNESISSVNNCDESNNSVLKVCDKKDNSEGEHSTPNREETTRHQRVNKTVEHVSEEKTVSEQIDLDSDRARMEARKRKFESKQCVIADKSKKISLKQIIGSTKKESLDKKPSTDSEETTTRNERRRRRHSEEASKSRGSGSSSAAVAFADTTEDLRISLKQRREERRNGRRKRKRKDSSPGPSRASPVIKSVLSIVKTESQKKSKKEKRTERSRRNKNRKKSPTPYLNEGKSHQNGTKLPVRLRLGRPVNNANDDDSDKDRSTATTSSRKREKKRGLNSTKRSRKELSTGVSDPYPAGDYQFKVNYDLEAKIRRIREQNQAIIRRHEEVAADRKNHT